MRRNKAETAPAGAANPEPEPAPAKRRRPEPSPPDTIAPERLRAFRRIATSRSPLAELEKHFAPKIIGLSRAKRAMILSMASLDDAKGSRGRIHAMLWGPPGGAKSSLIEYAARESGAEVFSPTLSPGSLTIDFRDRRTGAFAQSHHTPFQLFAIDEVEKLDRKIFRHFLRAMEEGRIAVPGKSESEDDPGEALIIPAHVRLVASANDIESLPAPFVDRFDYRVHIPLPQTREAKRVLRGIVGGFMGGTPRQADDDEEGPGTVAVPASDDDDDWRDGAGIEDFEEPAEPAMGRPANIEAPAKDDPGFIHDYVAWVRDWVPRFNPFERRLGERVFEIVLKSESSGTVKLRPYEGILRTAYTLARIRRQDVVVERLMEAVKFVFHERTPYWDSKFSDVYELLGAVKDLRRQAAAEAARDADAAPEPALRRIRPPEAAASGDAPGRTVDA